MDGGPPITIIHLFYYPFEDYDEGAILEFFEYYGQVRKVRQQKYIGHDVYTGTRLVAVALRKTQPRIVSINAYPCRVWYKGQPIICNLRGAQGHKSGECPDKDKCWLCKQLGHKARECKNHWGNNPWYLLVLNLLATLLHLDPSCSRRLLLLRVTTPHPPLSRIRLMMLVKRTLTLLCPLKERSIHLMMNLIPSLPTLTMGLWLFLGISGQFSLALHLVIKCSFWATCSCVQLPLEMSIFLLLFCCLLITFQIFIMASFTTLNVNGLQDANKRLALLQWLSHLSLDFACLQESHLTTLAEWDCWFSAHGFLSVVAILSWRNSRVLTLLFMLFSCVLQKGTLTGMFDGMLDGWPRRISLCSLAC